MSAPIVVLTAEQLAALIRDAVREALNGSSSIRSDSWISIRQTNLPPTTVRKLIKKGTIRAAKVGRELRVSCEDVERYMKEASAKKPEPEPAEVVEATDAFERASARARARAERRSA